jgi:LmbE family N-acetylglucosaminyl deacetylase
MSEMTFSLNLPDAREILVLAPHPDDEALGCAGTILQLNQKGASSTVVFLTDGECLNGAPSTDIAEKRRKEAETSAEMLGCRETLFLNSPDGEVVRHTEDLSEKISEVIKRKKPDMIFAPSPIDYHADHIAASRIALNLLNSFNSFRLAFYEVYSTIRFNCLVDITDVAEQKKQAIRNYRTSLFGKPEVYVNASMGLNAQRSIFVQRDGYFEAFCVLEGGHEISRIYDYLTYKVSDIM